MKNRTHTITRVRNNRACQSYTVEGWVGAVRKAAQLSGYSQREVRAYLKGLHPGWLPKGDTDKTLVMPVKGENSASNKIIVKQP